METNDTGMMWLVYALMTACCWGTYGIFLHQGQIAMADGENARYKAFLWVGVAYFITAVAAPLAILVMRGANWSFPASGVSYSLIAGIVGAAGAFCVLLSFGAKGTPSVVMSLIFGIAPLVNAIIAISIHPPAGGIKGIPVPFFVGILMLAVGGFLVSAYKPAPGKAPHPPAATVEQTNH